MINTTWELIGVASPNPAMASSNRSIKFEGTMIEVVLAFTESYKKDQRIERSHVCENSSSAPHPHQGFMSGRVGSGDCGTHRPLLSNPGPSPNPNSSPTLLGEIQVLIWIPYIIKDPNHILLSRGYGPGKILDMWLLVRSI